MLLICTECSPGYFGVSCREECKGHCINNEPCNHVTGMCLNGCKDGFIGTLCNNCKTLVKSILCMIANSDKEKKSRGKNNY